MKEEYQSKLFDYQEFKDSGIKPFSWRLYNQSQTKEKLIFLRLLKELCQTLGNERQSREVFCMCLKVYLGTSSRRLQSDIQLCKDLNYIDKKPCFNSVLNYFNRPILRPTLKYLIELSATPLAQLERNFAVDSTGISSHKYEKWSSARTKFNRHRLYKKAHIFYGTLTNIAVTCKVTKGTAADSPEFEKLLRRAAENFTIDEISADKAYSSRANLQVASEIGCVPYIPFKVNAKKNQKGSSMWAFMYNYFHNEPEKFFKRYHLRSNSETGFYMIKSKFGEFVRSKNDTSQENEIYTKILCHNICCLIQEMFLQDIEINFYESKKTFVAQD